MEANDTLKNIALLIDADNTQPKAIDAVLTVMAELGQVNIRRAYGNFAKGNLAKWDTITNKYGIRPHQQFDVSKGKNATDMAMTIDAIDCSIKARSMARDHEHDADSRLGHARGQEGIGFYCFGEATARGVQDSCTRFIDIDSEKAPNRRRQPPPSPLPNRTADTSSSTDLAAYKEAKKDEKGFAKVQQIGQIAGNRSSFDARNYGFKSLSELFRSLENYKVEPREGGQLWVRRLR